MKKYPKEMVEIDNAMNYFWDLLEDVPGIKAHRPPKGSRTTMGGWYAAHGHYRPEEFEGLSVKRFCEAVTAEGSNCSPGCNKALHTHPLFSKIDVYNQGKPTQIANLPDGIDARQNKVTLPVTEGIQKRVFSIPWFKHFRKQSIEEHAMAFRKVAENYRDLLSGDIDKDEGEGQWGLTVRKV